MSCVICIHIVHFFQERSFIPRFPDKAEEMKAYFHRKAPVWRVKVFSNREREEPREWD